jgi:hypothetical protein
LLRGISWLVVVNGDNTISIRCHGDGEPNYYCNENDDYSNEDGYGLIIVVKQHNVTVMII